MDSLRSWKGLHLPRTLPRELRELFESLDEHLSQEKRGNSPLVDESATTLAPRRLRAGGQSVDYRLVASGGTTTWLPPPPFGTLLVLRFVGRAVLEGGGNLHLYDSFEALTPADTLLLASDGKELWEIARGGTWQAETIPAVLYWAGF